MIDLLVKPKRDVGHLLVYELITLAFLLDVAIAIVERAFSAMKIVKSLLRNCVGHGWVNGCSLSYTGKEIFRQLIMG